jgi:hypothetical protein
MAGDPYRALITPSATPVGGAAHLVDTSKMFSALAAAMGAAPKPPGPDGLGIPMPLPVAPRVPHFNQAFPQQQIPAHINLGVPNQGTGQSSSPLPNGVQATMLVMQQGPPMMGTIPVLNDPRHIPTVALDPGVPKLSDEDQGPRLWFMPIDPCGQDNIDRLVKQLADEDIVKRDAAVSELASLYYQCENVRAIATTSAKQSDPEVRVRLEEVRCKATLDLLKLMIAMMKNNAFLLGGPALRSAGDAAMNAIMYSGCYDPSDDLQWRELGRLKSNIAQGRGGTEPGPQVSISLLEDMLAGNAQKQSPPPVPDTPSGPAGPPPPPKKE